jgi:hypothetical protein
MKHASAHVGDHQPHGQQLQAHQRAGDVVGRHLGAQHGDLDGQQPHPHGPRAGAGRFELRLPDGAANPYLLQAVIIAAGLDGMATEPIRASATTSTCMPRATRCAARVKLPLNMLDALGPMTRTRR